jgi:hypothetical protein
MAMMSLAVFRCRQHAGLLISAVFAEGPGFNQSNTSMDAAVASVGASRAQHALPQQKQALDV